MLHAADGGQPPLGSLVLSCMPPSRSESLCPVCFRVAHYYYYYDDDDDTYPLPRPSDALPLHAVIRRASVRISKNPPPPPQGRGTAGRPPGAGRPRRAAPNRLRRPGGAEGTGVA